MKKISLEQMKDISVDNLIELYRNGHRLDEHTSIVPASNSSNIKISRLSGVNGLQFPNIETNIEILQGPLLDPVTNFAKVMVSIGYNSSAISVILQTGDGSKLPSSGSFNLIWYNSTDYPDPSEDPYVEIVRCTSRSTDTLTIERGKEGTLASNKNLSGKAYKMILSVTAKMITDIDSVISARVAKSGDTMSGTLNLPSNGLVVGTNQLIVSGGNVGIGTVTVSGKLHIEGGLGASRWMSLYNSSGRGGEFFINALGSTGFPSFGVVHRYTNDGSPGFDSLNVNNTSAYEILSRASTPNTATILKLTSEAGPIIFGTGGVDPAPAKMIITNGGNVGIGTTSPEQKLTVAGNIVTPAGSYWIGRFNDASAARIRLSNGGYSGQFYPHTYGNDPWVWYYEDWTTEMFKLHPNIGTGTDATLTFTGTNAIFNSNIGIGTTSPEAPLEIKTAGVNGAQLLIGIENAGYLTNNRFYFAMNNNYCWYGDALHIGYAPYGTALPDCTSMPGHIMTIHKDGNVGIGTTSPEQKLTVAGNIVTPAGSYWIGRFNDASAARIRLSNGGYSGQFYPYTNGNDPWVWYYEDWTTEMFKLHPNIGTGTDATLTFTGTNAIFNSNIGIGTTSPESKLHISGGNMLFDNNRWIQWKDSGGNIRNLIQLNSFDDTGIQSAPTKNITIYQSGSTGFFRIGTNDTERFRIDNNGNVGIGTVSPIGRLHIAHSTAETSYPWNANTLRLETSNAAAGNMLDISSAFNGQVGNSIVFVKQGSIATAQGDIAFWTHDGTGASEKMRIKGNGQMTVKGQYASSKYIAAATAIDWNNGNVQYIQLGNGAYTLTFSNPIDGGRYMIILKQPSSGAAGTVTWPTTVLWPGGTAATLTTTNNKVDIVTFVYDGTNTKYYGGSSLNY